MGLYYLCLEGYVTNGERCPADLFTMISADNLKKAKSQFAEKHGLKGTRLWDEKRYTYYGCRIVHLDPATRKPKCGEENYIGFW